MENFTLLEGTQTLASSREQINNALLSVRSLSSGTSFPTGNLVDGMLCYRADKDVLYQYKASQESWTNEIGLLAARASVATDAEKCSGNATSATKLATARTINGVPFNGTGDITIVNTIAQGGTGATTAEQARANLGINGIPTGTIIAFAANSAPDGYLLCNGAAVSRTTYATLFGKIGTTYGTGDGSTTFALPNLTDKFIQGSSTAGTVKSAGLPNITGNFGRATSAYGDNTSEIGGAFSVTAYNQSHGGKDSYGNARKISFDASKSNSIYGASTTVQPPALTMRYYIKY